MDQLTIHFPGKLILDKNAFKNLSKEIEITGAGAMFSLAIEPLLTTLLPSLTEKTDKAAIRASLMGILLTVPVWMLLMFIGTALFAYYQLHSLPAGMRPDAVFPHFIMTKMPVGVVGLILSAMISASICSLSVDSTSLAAVGVEDYYKKLRPNKTDEQYLKTARWMVVISGFISILIGSFYISAGDEGVLGIVFTLYAIFSGGIVGIFLLVLFSARTNRQGLAIGIIACIAFTAYVALTSTKIGLGADKHLLLDIGAYNFMQHMLMLGVYNHLILIAVGYTGSLFFSKPVFDQNLLYKGWLQTHIKQKAELAEQNNLAINYSKRINVTV